MAPNAPILNLRGQIAMDEEEALAICFANLKGQKSKKNIIATAQALQFLKGKPGYGSDKKVGEAVGVSGEIVREFLTVLKLPKEIQLLFESGHLRYLEQSRRLWQLERANPGLLEEAVQNISDLTALDGQHVIVHLIKNPNMPVAQARKEVLDSKTVVEQEFHVIALLSAEEYKLLSNESRKRDIAPSILVTTIVQDWLESHGYAKSE